MARLHHNISYSDRRAELAEYKNYRRGASEDEFWDEDEKVDHRPFSKKKKAPKKKGCPDNDGNAHVYIWTKVSMTFWNGKVYEYERKCCCGCGKTSRFGATRSI